MGDGWFFICLPEIPDFYLNFDNLSDSHFLRCMVHPLGKQEIPCQHILHLMACGIRSAEIAASKRVCGQLIRPIEYRPLLSSWQTRYKRRGGQRQMAFVAKGIRHGQVVCATPPP